MDTVHVCSSDMSLTRAKMSSTVSSTTPGLSAAPIIVYVLPLPVAP